MQCQSCRMENAAGMGYCGRCGAQLPMSRQGFTAPSGTAAARWSEADRHPFPFEGAWWCRGSLGEVLRFDDGAGAWTLVPASATPFFMRRPKFSSLKKPAIWLYVLFGLFIAASLAGIGANLWEADVAGRAVDGNYTDADALLSEAQDADGLLAFADGMLVLLQIGLMPVFIWWLRRATCNAPALGAYDPKWSPGWAVGGWFVPFLGWWRPVQVVNQAWSVGDVTMQVQESNEWRNTGVSPLVVCWWVGWVVIGLLWRTVVVENDTVELESYRGFMIFEALLNALMAGVAVLAVAVVSRVTARQDARNRQFDVPATFPESRTAPDGRPGGGAGFGGPAKQAATW